jgi:hypothetical protein
MFILKTNHFIILIQYLIFIHKEFELSHFQVD